MTAIKLDQYAAARGGRISFLKLHCSKCHDYIGQYQKDGGFLLRRLYADRLQDSYFNWEENAVISCRKCDRPLAVCYIKKNLGGLLWFLLMLLKHCQKACMTG